MAETQNTAPVIDPELDEILHIVADMDAETRAAVAADIRATDTPNSARFADALLRYGELLDAKPKDRTREHIWESSELDPNGWDLPLLLTDMIWEAVDDLAREPYLIPKDDSQSPVGRMHTATARISLVLVPFLLERAEDLRKLRPAWITEIYHEALAFAKERSADWMPDEHEREGFAHYDSRYTPAA